MKWQYLKETTSSSYPYTHDHRESHLLQSPQGKLFIVSSVKNAHSTDTGITYTETILVEVGPDLRVKESFWDQRQLLGGVWDPKEALKQWGIEVDFPDKENMPTENKNADLDLTTRQGVLELMESSKTEKEWNDNCDKVKAANPYNGYPNYPGFWFEVILASGVASRVLARIKGK